MIKSVVAKRCQGKIIDNHVSFAQILGESKLFSFDVMVRYRRLCYFGRCMFFAPENLKRLMCKEYALAPDGSWRTMVFDDLEWMSAHSHDPTIICLGDPRREQNKWHTFINGSLSRFKCCVRRACKFATAHEISLELNATKIQKLKKACCDFKCGTCGKLFVGLSEMRSHEFKVHGRRKAIRQLCVQCL